MLLKQQRQLIDAGAVAQEQISKALETDEGKKGNLLLALLGLPGVDANKMLRVLAQIYKVPYLDISSFRPDEKLLDICPEKLCLEYGFVPVDCSNGEIVIAMGNPMDFAALDALQFKLNYRIKPIFARPDFIQKKIRDLYQGDAALSAAMEGLGEAGEVDDESAGGAGDAGHVDELKKGAEESPIIKLVNGIIAQSMKIGSSDIHIEAGERASVVRLRVDGRLRPILTFPVKVHPLAVSRIKIMSKLDISNTRTPQDGRARVKFSGKTIDMRISTLPSMYGEKVVIRILDKSGLSLELEKLAFEENSFKRVKEAISKPTGAVLVTGPTGSGKTTTLYSFVHHLNDAETNIVTVEDPVEFQIKGINQVQVNAKAGMTFAAALRSILRQDPDVVMVGEIRDEETAHIALHAAQTGHLVLSTLHTNDAPSTVTRLIEMGTDSTTLASSLNLVVAQRLLRRLCPKCKRKARPKQEYIERFDLPDEIEFYEPAGCDACLNIGYKGRMGCHEVLFVNDRIRDLISRSVPDRELMLAAREEGMFALFEDGMGKAIAGHTSIEEVLRISTPPEGFRVRDRYRDRRLLSLGESVRAREEVRSQSATSLGQKTIMIVDDSKSIRNLVRFVLQADGYDIVEAEDGQKAWDMLQKFHPDLIISDYEMPNMTGPELIAKIRSNSQYDGIAAIMLTSRKEEDDEVLGLETGADDYIGKPVEPLKLQARVKKTMSMYARIRGAR